MSDNRELKEARELLVIRADHAGRLADEVRELEAERDGLLAKIERVRASAQDGLENSDYDFGLSSFWVLDALSTTPAQSLANLQAATVLEYIDSPEHAESLREAKAKAWDVGFTACAYEHMQQDLDRWLTRPIVRDNPYRNHSDSGSNIAETGGAE